MSGMEQVAKRVVYFISDVHLDIRESPSDREEMLDEFFEVVKSNGSHLYIVGDLFDFWFEYKFTIPAAYLRTVSGLLDLSKSGIEVFYIPGNHDFWMKDYLTKQAKVKLTGDYHEAHHFGKKLLLTHGDGLRKDDRGYRFIKKLFRNRLCIWLYSQLPTNFAYRLAMGTSKASRNYTNHRDIKDSADYIEFAKTKIDDGYDAVVMGHVHKPEIVEFDKKHYVNCGDFFNNFSYVQLNDNGFELKYMKK